MIDDFTLIVFCFTGAILIIGLIFLIRALMFKNFFDDEYGGWYSDIEGDFLNVISVKSSFARTFNAYFVTIDEDQTFEVIPNDGIYPKYIKDNYPHKIIDERDIARLNVGLELYLENNISQEEVNKRQQEVVRRNTLERKIAVFSNPAIVAYNTIETKPEPKVKIKPEQKNIESKEISRMNKVLE